MITVAHFDVSHCIVYRNGGSNWEERRRVPLAEYIVKATRKSEGILHQSESPAVMISISN